VIKVSIIVPIYNVEKYLPKCIDSLVSQTLQEIEIILVNDASPDNSAAIMREYVGKYSNIKCIYLSENKCLGGARNEGIKVAEGKYVSFVDSDDYVDITMFDKMYQKAEETSSELTYCMFQRIDEAGKHLKNDFLYPPEFAGEISENKIRGYFHKPSYAWGKLFKRDIIMDNNILFPEHLKYEDSFFMLQIAINLTKAAMVPEALYYYLQRKTSILNSRNTEHHLEQIKVVDLFVDEMKKKGYYQKYKNEIEYYIINRRYLKILNNCVSKYDEIPIHVMKETRDYIMRNFPSYQSNPYYLNIIGEDRILMKMNRISPKLAVLWNTHRKTIMKKLGKRKESYIYYHKYYSKHKVKIYKLLDELQSKNLVIDIKGADLKKLAFLQSLDKKHNVYLIKNSTSDQQFNIGEITQEDNIMNKINVIIVVNPSFCCKIYESVQRINSSILVVNLEDYLEGYIELNYYDDEIKKLRNIIK
jgi:glycosyltransferase involved in cell wall biosynthesis